MTGLTDEQPAPVPNEGPDMWREVIADMEARRLHGIAEYGTPLQPHNGRKPLTDAYQEVLDQSVYLRQAIAEQEQLAADLRTFFEAPLTEPAYEAEERLREFARTGLPQGPGNGALSVQVRIDRDSPPSALADAVMAATARTEREASPDGLVAQPGDSLIIARGANPLTRREEDQLAHRLRQHLPGLAAIVFVPGVQVAAYRPHRIEVAKPYPDSDGSGS